MANMQSAQFSKPEAYDPRWFIWTIVFLIVTGISLVSYIMLSDTSSADDGSTPTHRTTTQQK